MSSLTFLKANQLLDQYVSTAREAFDAGANIHLIDKKSTLPCDDSSGSPSDKYVYVTAIYHVSDIGNNFSGSQSSFIRFWQNKGWKLRYGKVIDGQAIMISPDGFALNYTTGGNPHQGSLFAGTPCVAPSPTDTTH